MTFKSLFLGLAFWSAASLAGLSADLVLPSTAQRLDLMERAGSIELPIGQYGQVRQPSETVVGRIVLRAWVIPDTDSVYEISMQLVEQLARDGFGVHWQCASEACGGFDFRYGIETAPPPNFQVNIDDFYYFDMRNNAGSIVTLLSSVVNGDIYLQEISILPAEVDPARMAELEESEPVEVSTPPTGDGTRWVLSSVQFDSGQSTPSSFDPIELGRVAQRLRADADLKVYIVGHSDQTGSLSSNIAITRARAQSVRNILVEDFSVDPARIFADGVGFLAPVADNGTPAGQAINRRVEAVFLAN